MKINSNLSCPISTKKTDENIVRTVALFVFIFTMLGVFLNSVLIISLLVLDFASRAFFSGTASPLKILAKVISKWFKFNKKPVDVAPKRFAAILGFVFISLILIFTLLHENILVNSFTVMLLACALLESAFGFCLGCFIYTYAVLPFKK
ncbi:DUF4395 domain-containing protein [Arachidicoccus sp.]|jgi:hypothetical protein|uniref:DUF4395 domain-containing protein n=1 Tax=Arachidicoccus sp. TaxID=1872624 RepID=UPI003D1C9DD1